MLVETIQGVVPGWEGREERGLLKKKARCSGKISIKCYIIQVIVYF